jgi:hypothetical protein
LRWVISYQATGYPVRGIAQTYQNLSSPTSNYNVSLAAVNGSYYTFTTVGQMNNPLPGSQLLAYRNGVLVQSAISNIDGTSAFLLQPYFPYSFVVSAAGYDTLSFNFTPTTTYAMTIHMTATAPLPTYNNSASLFDDVTISVSPSNMTYTTSPFNITMNLTSANSSLEYFGATVYRIVNGTSTVAYTTGNMTNASGGSMNYSVTQAGTYQLKVWFKSVGHDEFDPVFSWVYSLSHRLDDIRASISGFLSAWSWYFLAVVLAMIVAGFISQYSTEGAGAVGLIVLWGATFTSPVGCVVSFGAFCVSPMIATIFTTIMVGAALYIRNPL